MIYFDNASSTKPDKEALDIFYENSIEKFFNPNSIFSAGVKNFNDIRRFKDKILKDFKLDSSYEVIFNSGATESNNLMILIIVLISGNFVSFSHARAPLK